MQQITFTIPAADDDDVLAGTWTLTDDWLERVDDPPKGMPTLYYPGRIIARIPPHGILSPLEHIVTGTSVLLRAVTDRLVDRDRALIERYLLTEEAVAAGRCGDAYPYREIEYAADGSGRIVAREG